ncbi:leucine-rich repeat and immunoglobulin-like domain-containing nogo receptor-interacting protein 4a [Engraulis encrasicolus]|uniref:leucine-rich repeat and immunoglobulin-like domain-containing nogo receptor-interacting protein 4a n=1 Tax=Engraulis encrasicolus TaxID=184585 RepID=UPI002FD2E7F8
MHEKAGPQMCVEGAFLWALCWRGLLLLWVVAVGLASSADSLWPCPQRCECYAEALMANCSSRRLSSVPQEGISGDTQRLDLSRNRLKALGRRQFSGLGQLRELDLSDNFLSSIEVEAFLGLQNLLTLRLCRNRLKLITVGVFSGLSNLRLLDLSENEIIVFLDYTFRDLARLQRMELAENDLLFISQKAFVGLSNLQELNINRCNLTRTPTEALSQLGGLVKLRLKRLAITLLPNNAFQRLGRLRELVVSHCPWLESLAGNSLLGLNLTSLTLSHCNLSMFPYTALHHLVYLRYLDLSYNPIGSVQGNLLGDLLRLQELYLVGASLFQVELQAFHGLAYLRLLNVSSNELVTLEEGVFHSVGNLEVLRLDDNPLACDCRLLWVMRRRLRLSFDGAPPTCYTPLQVQGRTFQDFAESEMPGLFTCRPPRIVSRRPQEIRVEEGHTVPLVCKANGDPVPSIVWLGPKRTRLSPTGRIRILPDGSLEVRYAQVHDAGTYLCIASNAAGNDTFPVSLRVRGLPAGRNRSASYFLDGWNLVTSPTTTVNGSSQNTKPYPFDTKTLFIAVTMGFLSFLGSVAICFVLVFLWSQSKGQIKHTAHIDYVPRSTGGGGGTSTEPSKFTMKLI